MVRTNALFKAKNLIAEEGIFKITDTPHYEYWIVKGSKKDNYEIIFHKDTEVYTCTCKNIRLTDCSHILAVKIVKGDVEDDTIEGTCMELAIQG